MLKPFGRPFLSVLSVLLFPGLFHGMAAPAADRPDLSIRHIMDTGSGSIRIAKNPVDHALHYLKLNGNVYRVDLAQRTAGLVEHSNTHSVRSAAGFAFGPDGTLYVVGNEGLQDGTLNRATIMRGVPGPDGNRVWSVLARTEPYPRSRTAFDHEFNGIIVSLDGRFVFVNSGSRTDHGEVQSLGGLFPGVRETPLTASLFRLPADGDNLLLENDREYLVQNGYLYAEGLRNAFDLAFAPNGHLFATENGPDRDMPEGLHWIREGRHYGFPWRMGGMENPQQFPDYNPQEDKLLDPRFIAVVRGYYHNDPDFPPPPARPFTEPIANLGPDANLVRDPVTGQIRRASEEGEHFSTFTPHRSPLGLVFDRDEVLSPEFRGDAFVLSWTRGDPNGNSVPGPFMDASEDLLHLRLTRQGENYEAGVTRLAGGFRNPIDSELIGNKLYVIEYGGQQGIWEITFPAEPRLRIEQVLDGTIHFVLSGPNGAALRVETSFDLVEWQEWRAFENPHGVVRFTGEIKAARAFYRAVER